jgi:hypothetical protein
MQIMTRLLMMLLIGVACAGSPKPKPPPPQPPPAPELANIDVYGSRQLDREQVIARWGDQLVELMRAKDDVYLARHEALTTSIRKAGNFAFVDLAVVTYSDDDSPDKKFLTVDLVDAADRERRMKFRPKPAGTFPDPDGLIGLWERYEAKYHELSEKKAIDWDQKCPFWHCLTFGHAELEPFREAFATRVAPHEAALATILREDSRQSARGAAAFLLAHLASGDRVVELMVPAIDDASMLVRNNAMRVLAVMAQNHPNVAIPLDPVLGALHYPTTTDRNKASAILEGMARRPEHHAAIKARAGAVLVDMLALRQPNNRDFAYLILKHISGRDLGEHAIAAWRAWLASSP